ncbi:MAG: hypothetical protein ABR509_04990 [Candidatus Limnocylindria bacterium]
MNREAPAEATAEIDLLPDEVALARSQLEGGLPLLAETTLRELLSRRDASGSADETALEPVYAVLAEALWRQQRPLEAGAVLAAVRPSSDLRRETVALMVDADAAAAAGDLARARALRDRVISSVGPEAAWLVRAGVPTTLDWPNPFEGASEPGAQTTAAIEVAVARGPDPERPAAARARIGAARAAFAARDVARGEHELSLALRLDGRIADEGIALLESLPEAARDARTLMLYGDLLAAAGRPDEAAEVYGRAAAPGDRVAR